MWNFLERLRQKPEADRFRIAVFAAGVVTLLIFLIWISFVVFQFDERAAPKSEVAQENTHSVWRDVTSTFVGIFQRGGSFINGIFDDLGTLRYEAEERE